MTDSPDNDINNKIDMALSLLAMTEVFAGFDDSVSMDM